MSRVTQAAIWAGVRYGLPVLPHTSDLAALFQGAEKRASCCVDPRDGRTTLHNGQAQISKPYEVA